MGLSSAARRAVVIANTVRAGAPPARAAWSCGLAVALAVTAGACALSVGGLEGGQRPGGAGTGAGSGTGVGGGSGGGSGVGGGATVGAGGGGAVGGGGVGGEGGPASASTGSGAGGSLPGNATCADGEQNGGETAVDCGGDACPPCALGATCAFDADCSTLSCQAGHCAPAPDPLPCSPVDPENPSCADCAANGLETDVDCGGDSCAPCGLGQGCDVDADCASESCLLGQCADTGDPGCPMADPQAPTCADCVQQAPETDVDCGGDACPPCPNGKLCAESTDCASGHCDAGTCAPASPAGCGAVDPDNPTCADCTLNGLETGIDCGGDACPPCPAGGGCASDFDCALGACLLGVCQ